MVFWVQGNSKLAGKWCVVVRAFSVFLCACMSVYDVCACLLQLYAAKVPSVGHVVHLDKNTVLTCCNCYPTLHVGWSCTAGSVSNTALFCHWLARIIACLWLVSCAAFLISSLLLRWPSRSSFWLLVCSRCGWLFCSVLLIGQPTALLSLVSSAPDLIYWKTCSSVCVYVSVLRHVSVYLSVIALCGESFIVYFIYLTVHFVLLAFCLSKLLFYLFTL